MRRNHEIERQETEEYYIDSRLQDKARPEDIRAGLSVGFEESRCSSSQSAGDNPADAILFQGFWYNAGGTLEDLDGACVPV